MTVNGQTMGAKKMQVVFRWEDGREEVRYERPWPSPEADELVAEVGRLVEAGRRGFAGETWESPYSCRVVGDFFSGGLP